MNRVVIVGLAIGAGAISFWLGWLAAGGSPPTRLLYLSVGQGDCSVFQTGGSAIVIDDGPSATAAAVLPKLRAYGIDRIDTIYLSHPDSDHVSGTPVLHRAYPGAKIAVSAEFRGNSQMLHELAHWDIPVQDIEWIPSTEEAHFGAFTIHIDCPKGSNDNDESMLVRIGQGAGSAEFSGDASSRTEAIERDRYDWGAEIMHAGHHGSRTATSDEWLARVHPQYVVISCGLGNRYGHPHRETLDRIQAEGAQILRTDKQGDIVFNWDGARFEPASQPLGD